MKEVTLTQAIYLASKPPEVRALHALPAIQRLDKAIELHAAGIMLDQEIDIWDWEAPKAMFARAQLGFAWVPAAFQPGLVNPLRMGNASQSTDMSKPWPGSITVSVDAADYPAFDHIPQAPARKPVGEAYQDGTGKYYPNLDVITREGVWLLQDGQSVAQDGKTFVFHKKPWAFGTIVYFTEAA